MPKSRKAGPDAVQNGHEEEVAKYEQELADYLQERIKPGLNSGAIPLLARSIAKDIAHRERPNGEAVDAKADEPRDEADDDPRDEADDDAGDKPDDEAAGDDEPSAEEREEEPSAAADDGAEGDGSSDFEADMHELQSELGEDWILRFSVQGDDAWLTAEKQDGSQRVEAATASVLSKAVALLNEDGGRSS